MAAGMQRRDAYNSQQCGPEGEQQGAPGMPRREDDDSEGKGEENDSTDGIDEAHGHGSR
jgi:hypothetical protein